MDNTKHTPHEPRSPDLRSNGVDEAGSSTDVCDQSQPQQLWILQTYKALREQGFYEPHIRVTQESLV
jgi:hypothetical protein